MRNEMQKRLHRVKIKLDKKKVICPYTGRCLNAENCSRCNEFFSKCAKFADFISESK
jgi:hypothetical protein